MSTNLNNYDVFMATTGPDRLQKILARHALFQMISDVPGDIVECGVFKGSGIYTWAKLMQLFRPNNESRIVGFDFFEAERSMNFQFQADKDCLDEHQINWSPQEVIRKNCSSWGFDKLDLIAGNVVDTTKKFVHDNLGFRIALLYIDVDNYEGALACLQNLYPVVSPGGLIVFDEYALRNYGESNAVDEFFRGKQLRLKSIPWANTPSAYLVKDTF